MSSSKNNINKNEIFIPLETLDYIIFVCITFLAYLVVWQRHIPICISVCRQSTDGNYYTAVYGAMQIMQLCVTHTFNVRINWIFENKPFSWISIEPNHKKMMLESRNAPLSVFLTFVLFSHQHSKSVSFRSLVLYKFRWFRVPVILRKQGLKAQYWIILLNNDSMYPYHDSQKV